MHLRKINNHLHVIPVFFPHPKILFQFFETLIHGQVHPVKNFAVIRAKKTALWLTGQFKKNLHPD